MCAAVRPELSDITLCKSVERIVDIGRIDGEMRIRHGPTNKIENKHKNRMRAL